jgi:hypothetical protein
MAIHVITQMDKPTEDDIITRQRREHAARIDPTDVYKNEVVTVDIGPKNARVQVTIRYPVGGQFCFAVYKENPDFHPRPDHEWELAAKKALEKFVAMRGEQALRSVKVEDLNPLNYMIEVRGNLR